MNDTLYRKVEKIVFTPTHVAEGGVWLRESSNVLLRYDLREMEVRMPSLRGRG